MGPRREARNGNGRPSEEAFEAAIDIALGVVPLGW